MAGDRRSSKADYGQGFLADNKKLASPSQRIAEARQKLAVPISASFKQWLN
jgi:hypothetical protein